jgi:nuclear transport factor 2 (NTF2) superfamily protein
MDVEMHRLGPAMQQRVRDAERAWNIGDSDTLILSNTIDCQWRNRVYFLWGREQIRTFIERQLRCEADRRLIFEPWAEDGRRLALRFASEFRNDSGSWIRVYGSEEMEFDEAGLIVRRFTTANEHAIQERDRKLHWAAGPRPSDHPSLSELGF